MRLLWCARGAISAEQILVTALVGLATMTAFAPLGSGFGRSIGGDATGSANTAATSDSYSAQAGSNVLGRLIRGAGEIIGSAEEVPLLFPASDLHRGLRAFPDASALTTGIPAFLTQQRRDFSLFFDFAGGSGINGSGVNLGDGYFLTARHVAQQWMDEAEIATTEWFVGHGRFKRFPEWELSVMPDPGSFPRSTLAGMSTEDFGTWRDVAIVRAPTRDASDLVGIRPMADLAIGERVWVVGKKLGEHTQVASGVLADRLGDNAHIAGIGIEGGFSGSPVLDARGRLVGVAVVREANGDLAIVNSEVVLDMLKRLQRDRTR